MKICLTVLMGIPGSGKTTFAQLLKKDFKSYDGKCFSFIHVCYDELLPHVNYETLQSNETKWKEYRTSILNQIDLLLYSVKNDNFELCPKYFIEQLEFTSTDSVIVILIDDNMYLRSMRYALFRKAKQYSTSFCQVYFKCSIEEANERNMLRASHEIIPQFVIFQMNEKIEAPKYTNKWEKYSLVFEVCSDNNKLCSKYFNMLNAALENPECLENDDDLVEKEKDMLISMTNVLHQCDIAIRQIISRKIQKFKFLNGSGKCLKDYSLQLSLQKGKILSEIRSGGIQVPSYILTEIKENHTFQKKNLKLFIEELFDRFL